MASAGVMPSAIPDLVSLWGRDLVAELGSPCQYFQVVVLQVCGKRFYEAFRVAGEGTLYSVATADLDELYAVVRETCSEDACG